MELAAQIAALRKKHGFSQEELGEKLGVSRQAVSKWESGQAVPELEKLKELSRIFGVSLNELLQLEESSPKKTEGAFLLSLIHICLACGWRPFILGEERQRRSHPTCWSRLFVRLNGILTFLICGNIQ